MSEEIEAILIQFDCGDMDIDDAVAAILALIGSD